MKLPVGVLAALLALLGVAVADDRPTCEIPPYLLLGNNDLKRVTAVVKDDRRLTVAVVGTGSSALAGPDGPSSAYPGRLEAVLRQRLPGVAVKVVTLVRSRQTAEDMAKGMAKLMVDERPDLVVWQSGTTDAIRRIEPDDFRAALDEGIEAVQKAGADIILMNMQYSPRTEIMLALDPYCGRRVVPFIASTGTSTSTRRGWGTRVHVRIARGLHRGAGTSPVRFSASPYLAGARQRQAAQDRRSWLLIDVWRGRKLVGGCISQSARGGAGQEVPRT